MVSGFLHTTANNNQGIFSNHNIPCEVILGYKRQIGSFYIFYWILVLQVIRPPFMGGDGCLSE